VPPPALALYALGRLSLLEGSPAIASERLAKARQLAEVDETPLGAQIRIEILIAQGDAALAENDATRAHGLFVEALPLDPKRAELHAKIATAHRTIRNLEIALQSYDRALALGAGIEVLRDASTPRSRRATPSASSSGATISSRGIPTTCAPWSPAALR